MCITHAGPTAPEVIYSEHLGIDSVAVFLEWTSVNAAAYNIYVSVVPQATIRPVGNTSAHLTVSYNILYNVSVVASLCGKYLSLIHI